MTEKEIINKIWHQTVLQSEIDEFFETNKGDKTDLINELLSKALNEKNGSAIDYILQCIYVNGKSKSLNEILCKICEVREEWQYLNEDIASLLGDIKDERSIPYLLKLVNEYPISDIHSIPLKSIWAIRKIGNEAAVKALRFISKCGDDKKMKTAQEQIEYYFE